jgi:hypothetical protein
MPEIRRIPLESGGSVLIEVDPRAGLDRASVGKKVITELQSTLHDSLGSLKAVADDIVKTIGAEQPGSPEWSVSFDVSISANA